MQNLIDQIRLSLNLRNIGHACNSSHFSVKICPGLRILLSNQISQLNPIHKRVKPNGVYLVPVRLDQRSHFLPDKQSVLIGKGMIAGRFRIQLHILQMLAHSKAVPRQFPHLPAHLIHQCFPVCSQPVRLIFHILKLIGNFKLQIKNRPLKRNCICCSFSFIHSEKIKVSAKIKNIEFLLIFSVQQTRTESCAPPNHLPEFCLAHNLFEKYQVQNLRHVDSRIQHIHGNGNLGQPFRIRKFINGALGIGHIVVDYFRIVWKTGVLFMEHFQNLLCMIVISGKNNRLSKLLAIINFYSVCHQDI